MGTDFASRNKAFQQQAVDFQNTEVLPWCDDVATLDAAAVRARGNRINVGWEKLVAAHVFAEAAHSRAILLFDEADSLFGKRTDVKSSVDRYANMEVNYLLQRMESFDGITILTTNHEAAIDEAFRRRLQFRLRFDPPDEALREQLWRGVIPSSADAGRIDHRTLARRFDFAGGYIRNAAVRAAFAAAAQRRPIAMADLVDAAERELEEMGRLAQRGSRDYVRTVRIDDSAGANSVSWSGSANTAA